MAIKRKLDDDKCYRSTVELIPNSQMAKELDRCIDYDMFCWNELLKLEKEYQDQHNGLRKKADLSLKEYRVVRNSQEWQLKLPAYILTQVNNKLKEAMNQVIEYNREIAESGRNEKFKKVNFKTDKKRNHSFIVPNDRILKTDRFKPKGKNYCFGICLGEKSVVDPQYRMMEITELPKGLEHGTGRILSATIIKAYNRYYVSFCMEIITPKIYEKPINDIIGIDPGVSTTLTLSNGKKYTFPNKIKKMEKKAEYYQSRLDKLRKTNVSVQSNNYYRILKKFIRIKKRISDLKKDWIHKITTKLVSKYNEIKWENVLSSKLIDNGSLSKGIQSSSWGKIKKCLSQKIKSRNGVFTLVNPIEAAATQTCSHCGYVRKGKEKLTLSDRTFICPECGYTEDRDINAAKNIAKF